MTSKKKNRKARDGAGGWHDNLKDETKHSIFGVLFFALALFFTLAGFGKAGIAGTYVYKISEVLFGAGAFLIPIALFLAGLSLFTSMRPNIFSNTMVGVTLFLISGLGAADVMFGAKMGGYVGFLISWPLVKLFDFWVSLVLLTALFIVSLLIMLNTSISIKIRKKNTLSDDSANEGEKNILEKIEDVPEKIIKSAKEAMEEIKEEIIIKKKQKKKEDGIEEELEMEVMSGDRQARKIKPNDFSPPPIELLENDKGKPSSGDIKTNGNIIKRTLQNFGIDIEMGEINVGPSVTQYTLKPAEGVKLSRIIALQNDLSLALAAHPLRIEAPIPGKALVGIEIPNNAKTIVGLAGIFSEETFKKSPFPLLLGLGKDVSGKSFFANMAKMPHLLIAGATGAGKSICIHSIIMNLLYRNSPESLRFIMIDPKRVELTVYNKIPHMLTPVITEAKKSILTLKWACKEMERRYETLLNAGVRDISSYHEKKGDYNSMPYLVIIIDELADLMATYPREMEASIVRLAQMSRAVGIHLIVSTQRPSVEVITGL
ncbi:MAG TPA: DNA translocase FtsK, partial [bacterium]|nr:DNA translocase FtsK [bacterium]